MNKFIIYWCQKNIVTFSIFGKVMSLLWLDKTELLGVLLGIVMCGMVSFIHDQLVFDCVKSFLTPSLRPISLCTSSLIPWQHNIDISGVINNFNHLKVGLFFVVVAKMNLLSIKGWVAKVMTNNIFENNYGTQSIMEDMMTTMQTRQQ